MHPEIQSDDPSAICPKCGTMKLIPREVTTHPMPTIKKKLRDFLPIIVIFSIIVLFTTIMTIFIKPEFEFGMRMFMGSFFLIFGFFKIINLRNFADAYQTYDVVAHKSRVYAFVYPFIELLFAAAYLFDFGGIIRDIVVVIVMTVSAIGVIQKLQQHEEIPCACLGMVFVLPMTWITLVEDIVMAIEAFIMTLMTLGRPVAYINTTNILSETLKIHTTPEWVQYSITGHQLIGLFLLIVIVSGIIGRFNFSIKKIVSKYIVPIFFLILGFSLSFLDVIVHSIFDNAQAVMYLLTHWSQFLQHFLGGILFLVAGIAEWVRHRKNIPWLMYITPIAIFLTGSIFFFHQQLGITQSVVVSMNWHMLFGACLVVGGVVRAIDLLLKEEKKIFIIIWGTVLLVGAVMMATYQEPLGAYQLLGSTF